MLFLLLLLSDESRPSVPPSVGRAGCKQNDMTRY